MSGYPIATGSDLAEDKILAMENDVKKEYIIGNPWSDFFGESPLALVHVETNTGKGEGDVIKFVHRSALLTGKTARGDTTLSNNEQVQRVTDDKITIDYVRDAIIVRNKRLGEIRSPVEIYGVAKDQLASLNKEVLRNDLTEAAAAGLTRPNATTDEGELVPSAASPDKARVLFGNSESNYNATLATGVGACDTTNDKLTVAHIRNLVKKAKSVEGTYTGNRPERLHPAKVEGNNDGMSLRETYVLLTEYRGVRDLQADPEFKDLRDDARNQIISTSFINRDLYVGMVDNVMIYEMPEQSRVSAGASGASSAKVLHNFFCGSQALGLAWGYMGGFADETQDYGKDVGVAWESIRGQKRIEYTDRDGRVLNSGLIHSFTATEQ